MRGNLGKQDYLEIVGDLMYVSQVDNEEYMHSHETTCMEDDAT